MWESVGISAIITTLFALLFGVIFIIGVDVWAPGLHQLKQYAFPYLLFLATNSIVLLTGNAFIALRKTEYYLLQSLLMGSRIVFLIPLVFLGTLGIFSSVGASFVVTLIFSLLLLLGIKPAAMDRGFLRDYFHFSVGNHVAALLMKSPLLRLMALSSFFVGICQVYSSIKRIQKDMKGLILLGALIFALLLGLSYTLIPKLGLSGIGYAWMISHGVGSVVVAVFARSDR